MKNYMIMCMAVLAIMLSSCKNEDISISREVTINVNPYTVVKDFAKYEYNPGDFSTVWWYDLGDRLRVQLFVYDSKGNLVESEVSYLENYSSTMNVRCNLAGGSYSVIAVTDEVGLAGTQVTDEYWFTTGTERLSYLKVAPNPDWSDGGFKKLGITSQSILVDASHSTFTVDVKPAGAMIQSWIYNIHGFSDVMEYSLWMNRKNGNFSFDEAGQYSVGYEQVNYTRCLRLDEPKDYTASNIYSYNFIVPYGNTGFRWEVVLDDNNLYTFLQEEYVNIQAGKSYGCILDIDGSNSTFSFGELDDSKGTYMSENDAMENVLTNYKRQSKMESTKSEIVRSIEVNVLK